MKRRLTSLLLVLSMCLTLLPVQVFAAGTTKPVDTSNPFEDVKQGSWYYDAVQYTRMNGIFTGTSPTTFWPDGTMTRGMFVTVLGRMAGVNPDHYAGPSAFIDVPEHAYYAPYVAWAAKYGVTAGTGDGTFSPDAYISRQQMAAFFVRYFEAFDVDYETNANITTAPADIDSVSPWARDAVLKLWRTGLLVGSGGNFLPLGNATRAQAATICYRADETVAAWYSEPGVPSTRVRINSATGLPYNGGNKPTDPSRPSRPSGGGGGGSTTPSDSYAVNFYDGSHLIKTLYAKKGEPLGQLPTVAESSKAGYILEGYYIDAGFTTPFYAETPVTGNLSVYAQYESMGDAESLTLDSFARMDQQPNVSFRFKALDGTSDTLDAAQAAVTLAVKDGTDPVVIEVSGSGIYTVSAPSGFNPGCSYELNLAEGWTFLPDSSSTISSDAIRTAAFSIEMAEVEDLSMNGGIRYVQDTEAIYYTYTDSENNTHSNVSELPSDDDITNGGSFNYTETADWQTGDILCIYVGAQPDDGNDSTKTEEAIYAKVKQIDSGTVQFEPLAAEDQMRLYEIPDNFPITVGVLPTEDTGTVSINNLDTGTYTLMVNSGEATADKAKEKLNVGDFVTLYVSADAIASENDVYFGEITAVSGETITYKKTTAEAIEDSANLYKSVDMDNTDMVTPAEAQEIQRIVQAQVEQSDFAEEAAYVLADMATQTDGFRRSMGVINFTATGKNGERLSDAQLASYAGIMELDGDGGGDDGVDVKVAVVLDPNRLHFKNKGVQLAVQVDAKFKVDAEDGAVHFDLSATFVQEVAVDPKVKGELVYKKILDFIPVPTGVQVNAIVDVKSYTAMSLRADIYTVAEEDKPIWEKFKEFTKDPSALADIPGLPAGLTDGLKTVGEAIDKIEETKAKIDKGLENTNRLKSDLEALWTVVEASAQNGLTRETYEQACETLGKTNVAEELMDMLHLTQDEISTEYINSLEELMDKYSELLEKETDWVQLVNQEMFSYSTPPEFGIMVGVQTSFVVRADINITLGTNLEYEVGKRYNFWFRVGLFKPTSGSSTMDLIDEHFAFQFYVMGKLGIKTGVRLKLYAAIGSVDAISVGLTTELGPYVKLWGFFIYDYNKYRPANTQNWVYKEQMAGALYLEFGLYLMVGVEAKALFLEYDHDFVDEEFPLLDAGNRLYYYDAAYEPLDERDEIVVYNDGSASLREGCAVSMELPADIYALKCIDLTTGKQSTRSLDFDNYTFKVSNPNFRVDNVGGKPVISVISIPSNVRLMQCDLTITYKHGKMAFSTFDMSTTVHLVWTNMTAAEYQQVYTASVTVPDGEGGREVIWSQRVRKGTPFDLPGEEEVKKLLSWSDAKYVPGRGYGGQPTEDVTLIENTQYYYDLGFQTYALTVTGIQDGRNTRTFTGKYGESFDFSLLANTGTDGPRSFTRFAGLMMDGQTLALNQPITGKFAASNRVEAQAQYIDETATATFTFTGVNLPDIDVNVRRGDTPDTWDVIDALPDGVVITGFFPEVGAVDGDIVYQVVCQRTGETPPDQPDPPVGGEVTISFNSNGGSAAESITRTVGAVLGSLPTPTRTGYAFGGWFTDDGTFANPVTVNTTVTGAMTLYAKWTAGGVTVTLNPCEGVLDTRTLTVVYGQPYGSLPTPERSGYSFRGWWTADDDTGTQVTANTVVNTTENHTLYAHWVELKEIPRTVFDFGTQETATYDKSGHTATYAFNQAGTDCPDEDSFTISYTRVSDSFIGENLDAGDAATMAGTYNVTIHRDADDTYTTFDQNYTGVLVIERATRDLSGITDDDIGMIGSPGLTYQKVGLTNTCKNRIDLDDSSKELYYEYRVQVGSSVYAYKNHEVESGLIYDLAPGGTYTILGVKITGDVNYVDAESGTLSKTFSTKAAPTTTFADYASANNTTTEDLAKNWLKSFGADANTYEISGWLDLLCFAAAVDMGNDNIKGKTIKLTADIDLSQVNGGKGIQWVPIGKSLVSGLGGISTLNWPFLGTFDGGGHTISGLYATDCGLFGCVGAGAVIRDLTLDDAYFRFSAGNYAGGGVVSGAVALNTVFTVSNCTSNAVIASFISGAESYRIGAPQLVNAKEENCTMRPVPEKVS